MTNELTVKRNYWTVVEAEYGELVYVRLRTVFEGFWIDEHVPLVDEHDNVVPIEISAGVVKMT